MRGGGSACQDHCEYKQDRQGTCFAPAFWTVGLIQPRSAALPRASPPSNRASDPRSALRRGAQFRTASLPTRSGGVTPRRTTAPGRGRGSPASTLARPEVAAPIFSCNQLEFPVYHTGTNSTDPLLEPMVADEEYRWCPGGRRLCRQYSREAHDIPGRVFLGGQFERPHWIEVVPLRHVGLMGSIGPDA